MKTSKFFVSTLIAAATMTATAYGSGETISLNFTYGDTGTISSGEAGLISVSSSEWTNIDVKSVASTELSLSTGESITATSVGGWQSNTSLSETSSGDAYLLKGYLDVSNHDENKRYWEVEVSNISYFTYDVYVYLAGDSAEAQFASVSINGQSYIGDAERGSVTVADPTGWGSCNATATSLTLGTNAIKVSDVVGSNVVFTNDWVATNVRATLAGIQIVNTYAGTAINVNTDGTNINWTDSSIGNTEWANSTVNAGTYAAFDLTADTSVNVTADGGVTTDAITVSGSGILALSGNSITLIGPGVVRTDADTASMTVANDVTFENGGVVSGNVVLQGNTIISGGTVSASTDAVGGSKSISVGKDATLDLGAGGSAINMELSGAGTVKYSFTSTDSEWGGGTGSGIRVSDDFVGTIDYTGCLNWSSSTTFGSDDAVVKLSSRTGENDAIWGNEERTFKNKFVFATDYGINVSAASLTISGDVVSTGTLNVTSSTAGRILTLGGQSSLSEVSVESNATINISGDATIGILSASGGSVSVAENASVSVGTLNFGNDKGVTSGEISGTYNIQKEGSFVFKHSAKTIEADLVFEGNTKLVLADTSSDSVGSGAYSTNVNSGLTIAGGVTLNGTTTYESLYWKTTEISGKITGEGGIKFSGTKHGTWGTNAYLILSNEENDFSGGIAIERNTGIVRATSGGALGTGTISLSEETSILSYLGTAGESFDKISNKITGSGSVYIDSGKVVMLGDNSELSGNILVNAGILAVGSDSALGTGAVTVVESATLTIAVSSVKAGAVTFNEGSTLAIDLNGFVNAVSDGDKMMLNVLNSTSITFGAESESLVSGVTLSSDLDGYFDEASLGDYAKYAREWAYDGEMLTLTMTIPEPSAFGLLAGLGALALCVSRRRRNRR